MRKGSPPGKLDEDPSGAPRAHGGRELLGDWCSPRYWVSDAMPPNSTLAGVSAIGAARRSRPTEQAATRMTRLTEVLEQHDQEWEAITRTTVMRPGSARGQVRVVRRGLCVRQSTRSQPRREPSGRTGPSAGMPDPGRRSSSTVRFVRGRSSCIFRRRRGPNRRPGLIAPPRPGRPSVDQLRRPADGTRRDGEVAEVRM
jgi:hypothetical protein